MKKYFILLIVVVPIATLALLFVRNRLHYHCVLSITNTRWPKVHVQVREGKNQDPSHDKLIFDQYLSKGQSRTFSIDNGDNIVYRRDLDPNHADGRHFTGWKYAESYDSTTFTIDNP